MQYGEKEVQKIVKTEAKCVMPLSRLRIATICTQPARTASPLCSTTFFVRGGLYNADNARAAEAASHQDAPPLFVPTDVFVGIICGWTRHRRSLEANEFG
jgi:hypothetical protein